MPTDAERLQNSIAWLFTIQEQDLWSRYGVRDGQYYKQHIPKGLPLPNLFPPKPIRPELYERAVRAAGR